MSLRDVVNILRYIPRTQFNVGNTSVSVCQSAYSQLGSLVLNGEVMGGVAMVAIVSVLVQRIGLGCGLVEWDIRKWTWAWQFGFSFLNLGLTI